MLKKNAKEAAIEKLKGFLGIKNSYFTINHTITDGLESFTLLTRGFISICLSSFVWVVQVYYFKIIQFFII